MRARFDAGGQFEVDRRSVAQRDPLRFQRGGIGEGHLQPIGDVGALGLGTAIEAEAARKAAAAALLALAEQPFEDVADIARLAAEIELRAAGAESARARAATPAAAAAGGRGIAIGVDPAAVAARAPVLVGEEIIGVGPLRKDLGRLWVKSEE